jgi:transposase
VGKHQVFDLPEKPLIVTEHQVIKKTCPHCGAKAKGALPEGVKPVPVQYGASLLSFGLYLRFVHFIPYERLSQLFRSLFGIPFAKGTVEHHERVLFENLNPFQEVTRKLLIEAKVLNVDETGVRAEGSLHWVHAAVTEYASLLGVFKKRGREGIEELGILPFYKGILVHDRWSPYSNPDYICEHALCGAHLLRDLTAAFENESQMWAEKMMDLLTEANDAKRAAPETILTREEQDGFTRRYRLILAEGESELPPPEPRKEGSRGRLKKSKAANLHKCLLERESEVLLFLKRPDVPFTNNLAEQGVRMIRLYQKISGCARTLDGARRFARVRSFVDTAKKQGKKVLLVLKEALEGKTWLPDHV